MVWSCNCDGVYIFLLENPAKVFVRGGGFTHLLLHPVGEFSKNLAVHIADMRDAGSAPVHLKRREMSVGAPVKADNGKIETIIGTDDSAIALCRSSHGQRRRAHRKCIQKLASCGHNFPFV